MHRCTSTTIVILLLPALIAVLVMTAGYLWECSRVRVLESSAPVVQPDWVSEARREAQRQAITNPWSGYQTQMPGGLK